MAPVFAGLAIGMIIGVPIFLLIILCGALRAAGYVALGFVRGARWDWAAAHTPEAIAARAERSELQREAGRARAERIRSWGVERREKDLAWMSRHWATAWCARLNRRLLG